MPDVRAYFSKTGRLKYISHLDLQRALARLLVRSGLPIVYTEGFNPHPRLNIALPLSVYQEGENEAFDFRISRELPPEEIVGALNAKMFPGSRVSAAEYLNGKNAPKSAVWRIEMETGMSAEEFEAELKGEMKTIKKSKSGEREVDIAPMIKLISAEKAGNTLTVRAELPASGGEYLNPAYIPAYFGEKVKKTRIVREKIIFSK
ncbi:MAG: TIGR03936 family radical SAM-associated protein [Clostridia bacterium]|nr:TIGR03936 family radical SAM-associated protein [Clostridia bacterium]